jgi:hypothetical protein
MTLEEFYYVSQIVASVAVLASLIYLALQTRQNTLGQRALMHQMRIQQMQSELFARADPAIAAAMLAAEGDAAGLTEVQQRQFLYMTLAGLTSMEEQFRLHKAGQYDAEHWKSTRKTLDRYLRSPGARVIARMYHSMLDPDFAALVDQIIDDIRTQPNFDRRAVWTALMEEELRLSTPAAARAGS